LKRNVVHGGEGAWLQNKSECDDARVARARAYDDGLHCLTSQTSWTTQASSRIEAPIWACDLSESSGSRCTAEQMRKKVLPRSPAPSSCRARPWTSCRTASSPRDLSDLDEMCLIPFSAIAAAEGLLRGVPSVAATGSMTPLSSMSRPYGIFSQLPLARCKGICCRRRAVIEVRRCSCRNCAQ
jgi:hypothetical protein